MALDLIMSMTEASAMVRHICDFAIKLFCGLQVPIFDLLHKFDGQRVFDSPDTGMRTFRCVSLAV